MRESKPRLINDISEIEDTLSPRSLEFAKRMGGQSVICVPIVYEQETLGRCRLRGVILSRLQTELDGRLVHTYVRKNDFADAGALPQDTEDAINLSLAIAGTQFAVILVEQPAGGFKISFRSRCDVDCSRLAAAFGGGGHKAAAGAFVRESFKVAQEKVLDHVRAALVQGV